MITLHEDFTGDRFDSRTWIADYLPHWTRPSNSAARWTTSGGRSRLCIDDDQPAWRPSESTMRVSSLQTGHHAGEVGGVVGQHAHRDGLTVATHRPSEILFAQRHGRFAVTMSAIRDPASMVAFWLLGTEQRPEESGEICVAEIFGPGPGEPWTLGVGVHPHRDPRIVDDFSVLEMADDLADLHEYVVDWGPDRLVFSMDGRVVKEVRQSIDYPMQLMLSIFDFPDRAISDSPLAYPRILDAAYVQVSTLDGG
ncbi:glycoside hydrolase family 16 protein [Gordonia sp. ABKF26]|uniref:glycoside hydrolase family 16 protein n=1 Tax=Gordonia sp. ABKF26 TaxID=3238687 RepID=UPI0034E5E4B7